MFIILILFTLSQSLNIDCAFRTIEDCLQLNIYQPLYACYIKKNRCVQNKDFLPYKHRSDEYIHLTNKKDDSQEINKQNNKRKSKKIIERTNNEFFQKEEVPLSISHSYSQQYNHDFYSNQAFQYENEYLSFEDEESSLDVYFTQQIEIVEQKLFKIIPSQTKLLLLSFKIFFLYLL